jgi:hypothetical protein
MRDADPDLGSCIQDPGPWILDPGHWILDPGSCTWILDKHPRVPTVH